MAGSLNQSPNSQTVPGTSTNPGQIPVPQNLMDPVSADTVNPAYLRLQNWSSYLSAQLLGKLAAPPTGQPPVLDAETDPLGSTSGTRRMFTVVVQTTVSDAIGTTGWIPLGQILLPGYGVYTYYPPGGISGADGVNVVNVTAPAWASGDKAAYQIVSNGGNTYRCVAPGTSTAAPTGTNTSPFQVPGGGSAYWIYLSAGGGQWISDTALLRGLANGVAALDSASLVPWSQLPINSQESTYSVNTGSLSTDPNWQIATDGSGHNIEVNITTSGHDVLVTYNPSHASNPAVIATLANLSGDVTVSLGIGVGATPSSPSFGITVPISIVGGNASQSISVSPSVTAKYAGTAGSYLFTLMYKFSTGGTATISNFKLCATEIV